MELSTPTYTTTPTIKNETVNPNPNPSETQQQLKPLSFSNGVLKRKKPNNFHLHHHHHHAVVVEYKECLKNHAATIGGHAVDGCGEFMSSTNTNPNDPTSLKCEACGCHRNFHRRDPEDPFPPPPPPPPINSIPAIEYQPHHRHHPPNPNSGDHSSPSSPSPPPISSSYYPPAPHMLLALNNIDSTIITGITTPTSNLSNPSSRKRHRTKFTQEQKEKMLEFAEKVGWKFQKKDEELIVGICDEVGIDKGVLKVWMHNNKNTLGKKDQVFTPSENVNINGNGNVYGAAEYHRQEEEGVTMSNNDGRSLNQLHQLLGSAVNGSASS